MIFSGTLAIGIKLPDAFNWDIAQQLNWITYGWSDKLKVKQIDLNLILIKPIQIIGNPILHLIVMEKLKVLENNSNTTLSKDSIINIYQLIP